MLAKLHSLIFSPTDLTIPNVTTAQLCKCCSRSSDVLFPDLRKLLESAAKPANMEATVVA